MTNKPVDPPRYGGPKPCGCGGVGHHPYCEKATPADRIAWKRELEQWLTKLLRKGIAVKYEAP